MESLRGTRTVKLERKKNGFGFSFKGGCEHGISIVVSDVEKSGAAGTVLFHLRQQRKPVAKYTKPKGGAQMRFLLSASKLQLGDEIIKVNGTSLQGVSHVRAVQILKGAGQVVTLTVRSNQALEGKCTMLT